MGGVRRPRLGSYQTDATAPTADMVMMTVTMRTAKKPTRSKLRNWFPTGNCSRKTRGTRLVGVASLVRWRPGPARPTRPPARGGPFN